jgi:hypothetical protein
MKMFPVLIARFNSSFFLILSRRSNKWSKGKNILRRYVNVNTAAMRRKCLSPALWNTPMRRRTAKQHPRQTLIKSALKAKEFAPPAEMKRICGSIFKIEIMDPQNAWRPGSALSE